MKRVKIMISAIFVMTIVAGALAFKAKSLNVCAYVTSNECKYTTNNLLGSLMKATIIP